MAELARRGWGLAQASRYRFADDIANGGLIEVLADFRRALTPLSALYPQRRQMARRIRVFLDWVIGIFDQGSI
jgi:DNA-binding transcriptional LysR family regulator